MKRLVLERRNYADAIMVIVIIVGSIVAPFADNKLNTFNDISLNKLTSVLLAGLLGISSICFSSYFLMIQLYQNRYPMKIIGNDFLLVIRKIIFIIIYAIIYGSILLYLDSGLYIQLWFDVVSIFTIIVILYISYKSNKSLMIITYIERYVIKIKNQLEKSLYDLNKLHITFTKMKGVFEECYIKEEFFVCKNISRGFGQVFQLFIEEQNKMILNGKMEIKEANGLYEEIISYSIYQIDISKNCKSDNFVEDLINNNLQNILSCIKTQQLNLFKKYISMINIMVYDLQKNENELLVNFIFKMYSRISKELITNTDIEWLEYLYDDLYKMTVSLNYLYSNINLKYFLKLLTYSILESLEKQEDLHKYLFELLKKISSEAIKMNNKFNEIVVYYAYYSSELISKDNLIAIKEFNELIFEIQNKLISDPKGVDFIFYYLSNINNKWENEFSDIVREKNVEILLNMISLDLTDNYIIMLPDFKSIVMKNNYDQIKIKKVCSDFYSLFNRAILKNNNSIFYLFSEKLNDCLLSLEKESKEIQKLFFEIYNYNKGIKN